MVQSSLNATAKKARDLREQIPFFKLLAKCHSLARSCEKIAVFRKGNAREIMKPLAVLVCLAFSVITLSSPVVSSSTERTYFIAAVERKWDYAPSGYNKVKGVKLEEDR